MELSYTLMKERKYTDISKLLNSISPMAAILINLRLVSQLPSLIDEGNTLA